MAAATPALATAGEATWRLDQMHRYKHLAMKRIADWAIRAPRTADFSRADLELEAGGKSRVLRKQRCARFRFCLRVSTSTRHYGLWTMQGLWLLLWPYRMGGIHIHQVWYGR